MERKKRSFKLSAKVNKRRLVISVTVLIILFIFIYNIPAIYDFFMYSDYQKVEGLLGSDYNLERYGNDILCYNNKEMTLINEKGEAEWSVAVSTTTPRAYVEDDYILLADLSGNHAYLYDEDELLTTIESKDEIYAAALDDDGNMAFATRTQGYKGTVTVYNESGEKKYVFSSGNGYISAVDIRDDQLVLSQIIADEKALSSKVVLVNWEDNEEKECENKKDNMIFDIKFQSNGDIVAVSDKGLYGYDDDGDIDFGVDFGGRKLKKYNIQSDDNLVFCFSGDRNNSVIESYSKSGKKRGERTENGEISNIDAWGEAILINNMRSVMKVYPDGDAGDEVVSGHDVRKIKLFSNRRFAIITGNSEATIIKVKN